MLKSFHNLSRNLIFHEGFIANAILLEDGTRLNFSRVSCGNLEIQGLRNQEHLNFKQLSLPANVENVTSENFKFSPYRNRDLNGSFASTSASISKQKIDVATSSAAECHNCSGAISFTMQKNLPQTFIAKGIITHLNMPSRQWLQMDKVISSELNQVRKTNMENLNWKICGTSKLDNFMMQKVTYFCLFNKYFFWCSSNPQFDVKTKHSKCFCTDKERFGVLNKSEENVSQNIPSSFKQKFKNTIKDYGIVAVALHTSISIVSLGCCYMAVASGVSDSGVFKYWGVDEGSTTAGIAGVFVMAYAIHKAMAPGRMLVTLIAAPFLVKKLRKMGFLKSMKEKPL